MSPLRNRTSGEKDTKYCLKKILAIITGLFIRRLFSGFCITCLLASLTTEEVLLSEKINSFDLENNVEPGIF